eukprot:307153-Pyramimonas_sp.AAC.1
MLKGGKRCVAKRLSSRSPERVSLPIYWFKSELRADLVRYLGAGNPNERCMKLHEALRLYSNIYYEK